MKTQLFDWRYGRTPRKEILEYFKSKRYLITSKDDEGNTIYSIDVDSLSVARMIEELTFLYDIMITDKFLAIDTKGYSFKQR